MRRQVVAQLDDVSLLVTGPADASTLARVSRWCEEQGVLPESLALGQRNLEDVFLDLTEYAVPRAAALDPQRPINDHGLTHLCFAVSDIDELHASMVAGGMTFHRAPAAMPAGLSAMGYARDPFGNALELIENRSPKAFMWCGHLRDLVEPS